MVAREVKTGIYWVGSIDWDRNLFDELIPLPQGTSYNSFLVQGNEKTALIDTVDPHKTEDLVENLRSLAVTRIDYIVINHAEQDHSGALPKMLELFPDAQVVTNEKCKELLLLLLRIPDEKFIPVADRQTISLGNKTLEFLTVPWVHWPDTMVTYLKEDRILFSGDLFGSHIATSDLFVDDEKMGSLGAKRYFGELMMPFRDRIKSHMEKLRDFDIGIIAPGHGLLYNSPEFILNSYQEWLSDDVNNEVIIAYVSMHGSTEAMVKYLTDALMKRRISVRQFNMTKTDPGEFAAALVDAATLVFGVPTILFGPHPQIIYTTYLANLLKPKARYAAIIGSFGWGGKTVDILTGMLSHWNGEFIEPVLIKGAPDTQTFAALEKLADMILEKHMSNPLVK